MNPWNDLGYAALGNAAALTVTDQTDLEKLKLEGFSDSVTVVLDERTPLFEIEAVGNSEQQATGTVREIIRLLQVDIAAKQKQYGTQSEDTISTLIINDGSSPQQDGGKIKRILIVAAGLGVLLTTALTIALDYWLLRRRSRRRTDDESSDDASTASEPVSVGKFEAIEQTRILHHQPLSRPSAHANGNVYSSERIADEHKKTEVKARAVARAVNGVKESLGPAEPEKTPGDATVVLPPSHPARRGQERRQ
jgi:hypothetical protein